VQLHVVIKHYTGGIHAKFASCFLLPFLLYHEHHDLVQRICDPKLLVHISHLIKYLLPPGVEFLSQNDTAEALHDMLYH